MGNSLVSCIVITYNSKKFFPSFFSTLIASKDVRLELIFIDNASSDGSFEEAQALIKDENKKRFEKIVWIKNADNKGYSGAADQGVFESTGKYILIANPDIVFESNYIAHLVERMDADNAIGACSGKLRRFDFAAYFKTNNLTNGKTMMIDSAGLVIYKNRRCVDRGQGLEDNGNYDSIEEVFGVTGACPFYRKAALDTVMIDGHYFEPDFFMYKEDIDICWRLRLLGWSCWYFPQAIAYHGRGTGAIERESLVSVIKNRSTLPRFTKHHSYRNERVMRLRNEFLPHVIRHLPSIIWREFLMFGWMLIREPYLLRALREFINLIPATLKKRASFKKRITVSAEEMIKWFT